MIDRTKVAALIPAYHEARHIRSVAARTHQQLDTVLVVDDGSPDHTAAEARAAGVEVLWHDHNQGKGAALKTGLRALTEKPGIEFILILDGDGQHLPEEIPHFLDCARETGAPMIVGNRMSDVRTMPFIRRLTNRTMSRLISAACGQEIPDSQCGFRMFRRDLAVAFLSCPSSQFDFESEMLVLASRRGCQIAAAPVSTIYGEETSKIRPVQDTIRFLRLMARLKRSTAEAAATVPAKAAAR
jgi:glycosyltransferase involved in cell wall biosynthesis